MTGPRAFLLVCGVLAFSACGSGSTSSKPADENQTAPAPPIEAIDEPAPDTGFPMPPDDASSSQTYFCLGNESTTVPERTCKPTREQAEKLHRLRREIEEAVKPAEDSEPRAIARLPLKDRGKNAQVRLISWRNQSDKLCFQTEEESEDVGGGEGPGGPCVPRSSCAKLCLSLSATSSASSPYLYVLSGIVSSDADGLRMSLDDDRVVDYALTGPVVPGFSEYRVFMLDLKRDLYTRLELLRGEKVIAEENHSPAEIRMMRCEEVPPALPSADGGQRSPVDQCLERAAPK